MTDPEIDASTWRRTGRLRRLAGWSVVSQAASAASNSVVELALALFAGVAVVGQWAVYLAVLQTAIYLMRAAAGEPLLADVRPDENLSSEPRAGAYLTLVTIVGAGAGAVIGVVALVLQQGELLVLAVAVPAVLIQDALRHLAFWSLRPKVAAILDLTWLAVTGAGVALIGQHPTQAVALAVWASGAACSAVVGFVMIHPRARGTIGAWWQGVRRLAAATTLDTVMFLASNQWLWFWVSVTGGAAALGVYRVALIAANPAMLLFLGAQTLIIPGVARRGHVPRWALGILAVLPFAGVAVTAVLALALVTVGAHTELASADVSAGTWAAAGFYVAAGGIAGPVAAMMRGLHLGRTLVASRAAATVTTIVCALLMIPVWETTGLLLAQALGLVVFAVGCVPQLWTRDHGTPEPSADVGDAVTDDLRERSI